MTGYELLEEVKRRYPPGTQILHVNANNNDNIQIIPENPYYNHTMSENELNQEIDEDYDAVDIDSLEGYLYNEGMWATIVFKTYEIW